MPEAAGGSATRWGPLFGARAAAWAETWEGPAGWGTPVYEHVLERAEVGLGSRVLDCGCGAGRFARMAADRGASVAGIDAANELIEIAAERVPEGDFRAGDIEALPWEDDSFDLVTGFSAFQFADDKVRALREARRVSRGSVAAVIPTRVPESGIAAVFKPVSPLLAEGRPRQLEGERHVRALRARETRRGARRGRPRTVRRRGDRVSDRLRRRRRGLLAFMGAGPTQLAIENSAEATVVEAVRSALGPFTDADGRVLLPAWYRALLAHA
jgi:SAM-dependent methyltransferase